MEATIFTGWIYNHLLPHAAQVKVPHPQMLRAIAAAKKKNDRMGAGKIADGLLGIVSGLAANTDSIFGDGSLEPETTNGCPVLRWAGTIAERHRSHVTSPAITVLGALASAPGRPLLPLDKDFHGSRQT